MANDKPMNKIELKKLPKKKKPKRDFYVSPVFRFFIAFSLTVLLFFTGIFLYNRVTGNSDAAKAAYEEGCRYYDGELYASALEKLADASAMDKSNVEYRLKLAACYEKVGDEQGVMKTIDEGVYLAPNDHRLPAFLIGYYVRAGRLKDAYNYIDSINNIAVKTKLTELSPSEVRVSPSPNSGGKITEITLASSDGAAIYYTLDGSTPSLSSSVYTAPIDVKDVKGNLVVNAVSVNENGLVSRMTSVYYNFDDPTKKYEFNDAKIAAIVQETLGKSADSVTYADLALIKSIDSTTVSEGSIYTLKDLTSFVNLASLTLEGEHFIAEYCDFAQLRSLTSISMVDCSVTNTVFASVCGISGLKSINFTNNLISSAAPVSKLTSLETAIFDKNEINSLAPFASLTSLKKLSVANNSLTSVTQIKTLTALTDLNVSNNMINEIVDLKKCVAIERLDISGNSIRNVSAVAAFTKLKTFYASDNIIESVSGLSSLTNLTAVDISGNPIISFAPLAKLELSSLGARSCGITDLSDFANLNVSTLDVSNSGDGESNEFTDLTPLAGNHNIRYLKLQNVLTLTSLAPLSGHSSLDSIYVHGCTNLQYDDFINSSAIKLVK